MRVMVFGTFDWLHPGHLSYLSQAGKFGEELIVIIARDQNVLQIKGRQPQQDEKKRRGAISLALKELGLSGRAVLGARKDRWQVVRKYQPGIIGLGYDQAVDLKTLRSVIATEGFFCKIKRLKPYYPEKYKSSYGRDNFIEK